MVQKQAALSGGYRADQFADDDPLAELARIVGFEQPRPGHRTAAEPQAQPASPAFNLEDELLREFETFEAPSTRPAPAPRVLPPEPEIPVAARVEPVAPAMIDEPFDWGDELGEAEFAEAAIPSHVETMAEPVLEAELDFASPFEEESAFMVEHEPEFSPEFTQETSEDLADELERAFSNAEQHVADQSWLAPAAAPARISLPLANFQAARPEPRREPDFGADFGFSTPEPLAEEPRFAAVEPHRPEQVAEATWPGFDAAPAKPDRVAPQAQLLDDLDAFDFGLDEVAIDEPAAPAAGAAPDFAFSFADDLAAGEQIAAAVSPAAAAPTSVARPPVARPEEPSFWSAPAAPVERVPAPVTPAAKPAPFDSLSDGEFELMLDDLDLDLSELDFVEAKAPAAPPAVAPVAPAPRAAPAAFAASVAGSVQASRPAVPSAPVFEAHLPFDPDDIAEQEEHPETIAMMDVPDLSYAEPKEPAVRRPEFDYDLDADLAGMFETPTPVEAAVTPTAAFVPTTSARALPVDDFDAFERALESDFRKTLQQPTQLKPAGRISLDQTPPNAAGRTAASPVWLLTASVAVVALVVAGGAYYYWFGGASTETVASGEPRVILADKDPIKVLPENPGGKSVPNQDKAVYDRVQGAAVTDPKQQSLISTDEEPVDVVQRTLLPDNLPLEGESEVDPMATPVGETEDPRLLPEGQSGADASAPGGAEQSAIAPRKVRTMIVKPDGTLVAQEMPAAAPAPAIVPPPATATNTAARPTAPSATQPSATPATADAPAARLPTPAAPATESAAAPAAADSGAVENLAPPAAVTAKAPVPSARPAEQPVNVVGRVTDQGNVAAPRAEAPAPQAPAPAAPAAAPAASAPASTGVPAGSYVIQIASLPSQADAQASYRNLSAKFANVIGGRGVDIKAAEIAGKGTYYRVRIPAGTKAEAEALCARYKAAGGSCLVAR